MFRTKAFTTAALAALASATGISANITSASAQEVTQSWTGTVAEDRSGEARFKMRGRFQYDVLTSDFDVGTDDGTRSYVRRAFLGVQGRLTEHWRYKVDFVLSPGASDASSSTVTLPDCDSVTPGPQPCVATVSTSGGGEDVGVDDAYLEYAGDWFSFVIGEHNVTAPLEDRTSSLDTPFNERSSLINAFGYGRAAGVGFVTNGANWMAAAAVQGDSLNNQDAGFTADELVQYSGRFTWAPIFESSPEGYTLVHLGASARYRYIGDDSGTRFRSRPLFGRGARPLDVGGSALGESDTSFGLEAAVQYNQFGATAEYATLGGDTAAGADFDFSAYYVDVFWSLTGEPRNYRGNTGSFGAVAPRNPVNNGGMGHWMLGARYENIEMSDLGTSGSRGEQTSYGVGLDWVPIEHVKFKLNLARSEFDLVSAPDEEAQIISFRTQFDF